MFYSHLLNIKKNDLVLEVGPGAYPYWRSDCLADKFENSMDTDISQFGGAPQETLGKPLFKINNGLLPFKDYAFDYVICAQVLEHVPISDLPTLLSEMSRVAKRLYVEVPRPAFDLVYDFDVHLNLMDIVDGTLVCLPKEKTNLKKIKRFTKYALELRQSCGFSVEKTSPSAVAIGREFNGAVPLKICNTEQDFFERISGNIVKTPSPVWSWRIVNFFTRLSYKLRRKQLSKDDFIRLSGNG